jgi:perosamine synthetase
MRHVDQVPVAEPSLTGREQEYLAECVRTRWISGNGPFVARFEKEFAAYCGRRYGVAVSSGTAALELAVSAMRFPPGGEVLLPAFTIVSCAEAVLRNGLKPVLVDCDPRTCCISAEDAVRRITRRTVALMPVHIYGHPAPMEELRTLARRFKIKVIEDASEAIGAEYRIDGKWRMCGGMGDISAVSFYANKNITCGEGGMILTDAPAVAELLRSRRNLCFGRTDRFTHADRGWNFRMTNMQGAVGCAQLERIKELLKRKSEISAAYSRAFKHLPLQLPRAEELAKPSTWMYAVQLKRGSPFDADEFAARLSEEGVESRPFFSGLHTQPCYRALGLFNPGAFPATEEATKRGLLLPAGQALTDLQASRVIRAVTKALRCGRRNT